MWIYLAGNNIRNLYGYILVDNLQPDIALDRISLPKTQEVELGKTLTLTPTFSPENTTNKIVTWSSSDESVATVDNAGKITPKKIGSTIITVTSQDGNKKASCTVTVIQKANEPSNEKPSSENNSNTNNGTTTNGGSNNGGSSNSGSTTNGTTNNASSNNGATTNGGTTNNGSNNGTSKENDKTIATGKLPQTGVGIGLSTLLFATIGASIVFYVKNRKYKGI